MRKATMTMPVFVPAPARDSFAAALTACAAQQLQGHRFANADPAGTEAMCQEILAGLYGTGVAYPRFSFFEADLPLPAGAGEVVFSRPRLLGARYMLTVTHGPSSALLDLQYGDDTCWGPEAEGMLVHMEDLIVQAAGR
ncbi:hypothetical protein ACFQYP_15775 [Nonomuraea antimicrobica]